MIKAEAPKPPKINPLLSTLVYICLFEHIHISTDNLREIKICLQKHVNSDWHRFISSLNGSRLNPFVNSRLNLFRCFGTELALKLMTLTKKEKAK